MDRASGWNRASPRNGPSLLWLPITLREPPGSAGRPVPRVSRWLGPGVLQRLERPLEIVDVLAQGCGHLRIKVIAGHCFHDLERLLERVRRLVIPRGRERVEDVGDRH